jgi:hypothetical protein
VTAAVIARWTDSSLILTGWGWLIVGLALYVGWSK